MVRAALVPCAGEEWEQKHCEDGCDRRVQQAGEDVRTHADIGVGKHRGHLSLHRGSRPGDDRGRDGCTLNERGRNLRNRRRADVDLEDALYDAVREGRRKPTNPSGFSTVQCTVTIAPVASRTRMSTEKSTMKLMIMKRVEVESRIAS